MRIDSYSLELFLAVVREGSITRASRLHHIAPSALSRRIADLEEAIGRPLLIRSPCGVKLTEAGHHAFVRAARLHDDLQSLVREVHALGDQVAGTVRLFANASAAVGFLPEKLRFFRTRYPRVQVVMTERISDEVLRACAEDRADIGVCVASSDFSSCMESWHFADDPLMVVLPLEHELSAKSAVTFEDVSRYPLVALHAGGALYQTLRERASASRLNFQVSVAVDSFDAQCRMVDVGLGIGIVPRSAARAFVGTGRITRRYLDEPWGNRRLHVHALRNLSRLKAVQALIDVLVSRAGQGLP